MSKVAGLSAKSLRTIAESKQIQDMISGAIRNSSRIGKQLDERWQQRSAEMDQKQLIHYGHAMIILIMMTLLCLFSLQVRSTRVVLLFYPIMWTAIAVLTIHKLTLAVGRLISPLARGYIMLFTFTVSHISLIIGIVPLLDDIMEMIGRTGGWWWLDGEKELLGEQGVRRHIVLVYLEVLAGLASCYFALFNTIQSGWLRPTDTLSKFLDAGDPMYKTQEVKRHPRGEEEE